MDTNVRPLVTIAIPTLGRIEYLRQALASARAQTYSRIEILIGDNSDNSATHEAITTLIGENPGTRVLTQKSRLSMAGHWNALADEAKGEFTVILADDDLLEPGFIARMVDLRSRAPEAKVLFSDHWIIDENGTIDSAASDFYSKENGRLGLAAGLLADSSKAVWSSSIPICASMLETALIRKYRFNGELNTPEIEFFARVVADGARFAYSPERLARYRVHGNSETQSVGLRNDLLFRSLKGIPVSPSAEDARRTFLENLLVTAVTGAYLAREMKTVREFLDDPLYPRHFVKRPVALLQRFCAKFSDRIAPPTFEALYRRLRKVQRINRG